MTAREALHRLRRQKKPVRRLRERLTALRYEAALAQETATEALALIAHADGIADVYNERQRDLTAMQARIAHLEERVGRGVQMLDGVRAYLPEDVQGLVDAALRLMRYDPGLEVWDADWQTRNPGFFGTTPIPVARPLSRGPAGGDAGMG